MGTGAEDELRVFLRVALAGGLGGTMNCGVEGVDGTEGVVGVERDEEVLLAASKAIE